MAKGSNTPVPVTALRVEVTRRAAPGIPDVDASALLLASGRARVDGDFVFCNQPVHPSGAVRHEGKATSGAQVTDTLLVDLARVEAGIERIVLAASADGGSFGQVPGLAVQVLDLPRETPRPASTAPAPPWRPPSSSASSTAARAPGSSGPWARVTTAGSRAWRRTSASPSTYPGTRQRPPLRLPR